MPEAAIDEERDIHVGKYEVGLTEHMRISPPAGYSVLPKQRDHSQFRVAVSAAADAGHYVRAFRACKDIRHTSVVSATTSFRGAMRTLQGPS